MAAKKKTKQAAPRLRGYGERTTDEKRDEALTNVGLAPPALTAYQLGQLYGLEELAHDADLAPHTLRRVLMGEHGKEPVDDLYKIANAPGWKRVKEAPTSFTAWRLLWDRAHNDKFVKDHRLNDAVATALGYWDRHREASISPPKWGPRYSEDELWRPDMVEWLQQHKVPFDKSADSRTLCELIVSTWEQRRRK